ncbi:CD44 antigen [Bombina bombina]|uniref:CD44 antigen n=1 Tax=Bombina bombina TaxID=8345 RepID=UPI00235A7859|nr:CD44 antigen [Bombina bombina]
MSQLQLLWICAFGLCSLLHVCQSDTAVSCRFRGIFHVEKGGRYRLTLEEAEEVCAALNSTLATIEQMKEAYDSGFETCRYGWIEGHIVIPRITKNPICAANHVGIYILTSNITQHYDVYCFNESETRDKVCDPVVFQDAVSFDQKSIDSYDPSLQDTQNPSLKQNSEPEEGNDYNSTNPTQDGHATDQSDVFKHPDDDQQGTTDPESVITDDYLIETIEPTDNSIYHSGDGRLQDGQIPFSDYTDQDNLINDETTTDLSHHGDHALFETNNNGIDDVTSATDSDAEKTDEDHPHDHDHSSSDGAKKGGRMVDHTHDHDLEHDPSANGSISATSPKQRRGALVPDWLIVTVSLVCLGLILSVCIALNSSKFCGKKKKLVINGKKASLEDGGMMDHNGDTAKSQEMVHLVNRDPAIDPYAQNNTNPEDSRNMRDVDMKIGV